MPAYTTFFSDTFPTSGFKSGGKITITGTKKRSLAIELPSHGKLALVVVKQVGGVSVNFTVDVLCSKVPFPVGEYAVAAAAVSPVELYQVIQQQSATAGNAVAFRSEYGQPYRNVDGSLSANERDLYLLITPSGAAGATDWDVAVTIELEA